VLEVIEERADQWRVEISDVQVARRCSGVFGGEAQQQADRVAVGRDRVLACVTLLDQPVR